MNYRYLILVGDNSRWHRDSGDHDALAALSAMGLVRHPSPESIILFASKETPVAPFDGGCVVGHVFTRASADARLQDDSSKCRPFVEGCWGAYLLIHPTGIDELKITRDPSGGVPCVYSISNGSGFITSDISIAAKLGLYQRRIDWDFIAQCLAYPHLKVERTGLSGVRELLAGCTLSLSNINISTDLAWSPWNFTSPDRLHRDPGDAATDIRETIDAVVKAWATTDKSILLELSGGLDSSVVGVCLRNTPARVVCCTVVSPVPGADERHYAALIANQLGVGLHAEVVDFDKARIDFAPPEYLVGPWVGPLQHALDEVIESAGDRFEVDSFYSGSGGDTVFCYIPTAAPAADAFRACSMAAGFRAIHELSELHQCTAWKAARLTARKLLRAPKAPCKADPTFLTNARIPRDEPRHPWFCAPADALPGDRERITDLAGTQLFQDSSPRVAKRPRRMPLLAQPVVEAALKTPSWMWIAGGRNRAVARAAFADRLPADVLNRRSKGTFMSYLGGAYQRNRESIRDFLMSGHLHQQGLLDESALLTFLDAPLSPRDLVFTRVLDLCRIENWIRHQS